MSWLQLILTADKAQAPTIEALFEGLGALAVTYGDAGEQPLLEPAPGEARLWSRSRITALFDAQRDPDLLRAALRNALPETTAQSLELQTLEDQVWERAWLDDFHPMRFGDRLWVCPAGQRPQQADAVVLDLDPGLAFGTGAHPTTALCLQWLDGAELHGKRVLDYGCGSGILAIAAALLGAESVAAVDYDPQALAATQDNAAKNRVQERITPLLPEQTPNRGFDIVLANILAEPLVELAPELQPRVTPGGHLLLSGILAEQAEQVAAAYRKPFDLDPPLLQDEWVLLHGRRREGC
jgi:ribosomal protein L11 methyltransferase